ncbi:MAG: hypothetical protein ACI9S9_001298 [Planctomycetota bacterium]|jgi:hypothetical protein
MLAGEKRPGESSLCSRRIPDRTAFASDLAVPPSRRQPQGEITLESATPDQTQTTQIQARLSRR